MSKFNSAASTVRELVMNLVSFFNKGVGTDNLTNGSVTTDILARQSVTTNILAPSSVTANILAVESVTTDALTTELQLGWLNLPELTYVSAFVCSAVGDITGIIQKGDRVQLAQIITKFFIVFDASYNSETNLTTITFLSSSDYSLANITITNPYYSKMDYPQGFPSGCWLNYIPSDITGFSADPVGGIYRFRMFGNVCHTVIRQPTRGTSNANTFTITAPCNARNIVGMYWVNQIGVCYDNSAASSTRDVIIINANSNIITCYKNNSNVGWTASGEKSVSFAEIWFET